MLVPKVDGSQRFCIDYRKVYSVTRSDSYPIPRIDESIDRIGQARYVSKFDLLKGYRQVPLTFGMKNAPSTFQLEGCVVYGVLVYSDTFQEHIRIIQALFQRLDDAGLTINLAKSEIGGAQVTYRAR